MVPLVGLLRDRQTTFAKMAHVCIPAQVFASPMDQTAVSGIYLFVKELKSLFVRVGRGLAIILPGVGAVPGNLTVHTGLSATEEAGIVQTVLGAVALHPAAIHQTRHNLAVIQLFVTQESGTVHDSAMFRGIQILSFTRESPSVWVTLRPI